jgi:hypothetical protein
MFGSSYSNQQQKKSNFNLQKGADTFAIAFRKKKICHQIKELCGFWMRILLLIKFYG